MDCIMSIQVLAGVSQTYLLSCTANAEHIRFACASNVKEWLRIGYDGRERKAKFRYKQHLVYILGRITKPDWVSDEKLLTEQQVTFDKLDQAQAVQRDR